MMSSLIAVITALAVSSALPSAAATVAKAEPSLPRPDGTALPQGGALPSGGADFDTTMLRWSRPAAVSVHERLELPVAVAHLSSRFGIRRDPLHGGMRAHRGIDIPDPVGTPVHAAGSGTVTFAGWSRGYGNMVRIDHGDGNETRYAHLRSITVVPGAVSQGAVIGNVGSTGRSTGAHLHFEVRQRGAAVDPMTQDGVLLARGEREPLVPLQLHWSGYGPDATALPQSRLR
ncbi:M23 family metallopeptidase [Sphingomonas sp. PvP056]|uniref:M23 family metallopeptidase n=1 Tax=Sphingomonas sp. PvP056 TaxID=3156392 RepID=UPI00339B3156